MPSTVIIALVLIIAVSVAHSYLGERYILKRLLKQNLPPLRGDANDTFTKQILRLAWHLPSFGWLGLGAVVYRSPSDSVLLTVGCVFLAQVPLPLVGTKGRHISWIAFLAIGLLLVPIDLV